MTDMNQQITTVVDFDGIVVEISGTYDADECSFENVRVKVVDNGVGDLSMNPPIDITEYLNATVLSAANEMLDDERLNGVSYK